MDQPRTLVGRYELLQSIGRGGMGQVWAATDERLRRRVAVKTVELDSASDAVAAQRFRQEALATAALSHPHIVTVYDSGVDADTAFIVMELLPGPSLEQVVRTAGALPVDDALAYCEQVASALGAAHAAGVIHRDIKPSNLMLDGRGGIKVVDFGIARLDQERSSKLTATATVVGSAPYLSPEQATGGTASPQSDLYSLGCVLTTLLTGEPPFIGEHPLATLHQHLSSVPPLPSSRRPGIDPAIDELVAQLLAKDPADRPASAGDVADRLALIRRGASAHGTLAAAGTTMAMTPVPDITRTAEMPAVPDPAPARAATAPAAVRHEQPPRRSGAWLLPLLALLALAGIGWYFLLGPGAHRSSTPGPTQPATVAPTTTLAPSSSTAPAPTTTEAQVTTEPAPSSTTAAPPSTTSSPTTVTQTVTETATARPTTDAPSDTPSVTVPVPPAGSSTATAPTTPTAGTPTT